MHTIKFLIFALCSICLTFAKESPVLLWGTPSVAKPSLKIVSPDEFLKLMTPLLADKALVCFLENDLNTKDFLCTNIADGNACYARLQGVTDKTYYAAVDNPVETLRTISEEIDYVYVDASGKLSKPLQTDAGKINFLKFVDEDGLAVRRSNLQSHDSIITSITSQLKDKVFFMYASAPSVSLKRQVRQTSNSSKGYVFRNGANLLMYYNSLSVIVDKSVTVLEIDAMNVKSDNATTLSVSLSSHSDVLLTFDIILEGGYFFMKNLMYKNIKFLSSNVYAPTDFSYFCGNLTLQNVIKANVSSYTLNWNTLQLQAPFGYTKNTTFAFSDAWHCVGFFTGGILSGLLIVALLLSITFIGICWMVDINTMDRFDDPKGKSITISASD